jgi:hypothetical protein
VLFNGFCRLCFCLRSALLCWFSLSFTICFGLHGYLQVCRSFIVLVSTVFHYMSRPAWLSSCVGALLCWFSLSFTTCLGLYGYLHGCSSFIVLVFHCLSLHLSAYMAIFRCVGALLCSFSLSFTTSFGLHGHLHVCRSFIVLVFTLSLHISAIIL